MRDELLGKGGGTNDGNILNQVTYWCFIFSSFSSHRIYGNHAETHSFTSRAFHDRKIRDNLEVINDCSLKFYKVEKSEILSAFDIKRTFRMKYL